MEDKPIIRHCRNCKYYNHAPFQFDCSVRYEDVFCERIRALFCRYYKKKEEPIEWSCGFIIKDDLVPKNQIGEGDSND